MGVGHAAVALGAARVAPRLNVGWLIFAALLADFLLGIFAAMGLERAHVPPDFASGHYLTFTFPYSHGLVALVIWSGLAGLLLARKQRRNRSTVFVVAASLVLSHFVLDALVHVVGLPFAGERSPKIGLGLWREMPLELSLETLMAAIGVALYWTTPGARTATISRWGIAAFMLLFTASTWTQLLVTTPPDTTTLVPAWIGAPLVLSAIAYALDRKRVAISNQ
jgi:hypothetical protein